jgi:hypothetical protein
MATPARGSRQDPVAERRAAASARARKRAAEKQSERRGRSCVSYSGKFFEKKAGVNTLITVLPYVVKERHHPDKIEPGELWYKRPYLKHGWIGMDKDNGLDFVCPKSFGKASSCIICDDVSAMRKDYERNKDSIKALRATDREIYLFYLHDAGEVRLYEDSYGAFGDVLDARLRNPRQGDIWAAFYLPRGDGFVLDVNWEEKDIGQKNPWVKAVSMDFLECKEYPVPDKVWDMQFELSQFLVKSSDKDIEKAYLGSAEGEDQPEEETEPDLESESQKTSSAGWIGRTTEAKKETEEAGPELIEDKDELLAYAKDRGLKDEGGKLIYRYYARKDVSEIKTAVLKAEGKVMGGKGKARKTPSGECPFKHKFGFDFGESEDCFGDGGCPEDVYSACMKAYDGIKGREDV